MKKNTSWKFTDELSVTFQSPVSGAGEFGLPKWTFFRVLAHCDLAKQIDQLSPPVDFVQHQVFRKWV